MWREGQRQETEASEVCARLANRDQSAQKLFLFSNQTQRKSKREIGFFFLLSYVKTGVRISSPPIGVYGSTIVKQAVG